MVFRVSRTCPLEAKLNAILARPGIKELFPRMGHRQIPTPMIPWVVGHWRPHHNVPADVASSASRALRAFGRSVASVGVGVTNCCCGIPPERQGHNERTHSICQRETAARLEGELVARRCRSWWRRGVDSNGGYQTEAALGAINAPRSAQTQPEAMAVRRQLPLSRALRLELIALTLASSVAFLFVQHWVCHPMGMCRKRRCISSARSGLRVSNKQNPGNSAPQ